MQYVELSAVSPDNLWIQNMQKSLSPTWTWMLALFSTFLGPDLGLLARRKIVLLFEKLCTVIYGLVLASSSWDIRQSYFVMDNLRWGKHTAFIFSCHRGHFFSSIVSSSGISFPCNQFKLKTLMSLSECYTACSLTLSVFLQKN